MAQRLTIQQDEIPPNSDRHQTVVIGIGGAGANALDRIALESLVEGDLVCMNTDARDLSNAVSSQTIQLGASVTRGLGTGGDPELGRESALADVDSIDEILQGRSMVFLCVGLGGGTGSGAAPVIAQRAREAGIFVATFATLPFSFEGTRRLRQARTRPGRIEHSGGLCSGGSDDWSCRALGLDGDIATRSNSYRDR